jgi:hypothetical protein
MANDPSLPYRRRSAVVIPPTINAPAATTRMTSTSVICSRGSKIASSTRPANPPASPPTVISAATTAGRRGHLCASVKCPLHRGQVDIGNGESMEAARHHSTAEFSSANTPAIAVRRKGGSTLADRRSAGNRSPPLRAAFVRTFLHHVRGPVERARIHIVEIRHDRRA